jgi:hypothetical protein
VQEPSKVGGGEPRARCVLLGASNLAQGLRTVLTCARAELGAPLEAYGALGRGRSYGPGHSWFLIRRMKGIAVSGLWPALAAAPPRPTYALVTDVGNDLPFGAQPATILGWVGQALEQLEGHGARCLITALPLENLHALSPAAFGFWRRVIFPTHGISRDQLLRDADALDSGLRRLCAARGHTLVEPRRDWYGIDPVHVWHSKRSAAWTAILAGWHSAGEPPRGSREGPRWPPSILCVPQRRWVLGFEGGRDQPCVRLSDGSTLSLY